MQSKLKIKDNNCNRNLTFRDFGKDNEMEVVIGDDLDLEITGLWVNKAQATEIINHLQKQLEKIR